MNENKMLSSGTLLVSKDGETYDDLSKTSGGVLELDVNILNESIHQPLYRTNEIQNLSFKCIVPYKKIWYSRKKGKRYLKYCKKAPQTLFEYFCGDHLLVVKKRNIEAFKRI